MRKHVQSVCKLGPLACQYCDRDDHPELFTCELCTASEGELTSECPGVPIPYDMRELAFKRMIDFKDGHWQILHTLRVDQRAYYDATLVAS